MTPAPVDMTPIIDRVTEVAGLGGRVSQVFTMEDVRDFVARHATAGGPSAAIVGPYEKGDRRETIGGTSQQIGVQFDVVTCVRYAGDRKNGAEDLESARAEIIAKLFGWRPATRHGVCQKESAGPLVDSPGMIAWYDRFSTYYRLEA